ncbi:hypothetical protein C9J40_04155 [Photobacterium sp. GB-72]|nr:hypothetical protein C9J40_04155 [Photobacterium sp. GB-72]
MPLLNSPYWFGGVCHDIIASSKHRGLLNLFFESDRFILASFFFIKRLGYKKNTLYLVRGIVNNLLIIKVK